MTTGGLRETRLAALAGRNARPLISLLVAVVVVVVWWWPGLSGGSDDIDVELVIGDGLSVADQPIERRLREEGFLVARTPRPVDWCAVPTVVEDLRPESTRLVLWAEAPLDCDLGDVLDRVLDVAGDRQVIVVRLPTDESAIAEALEGRDVNVVDTARLLGEPGESMECVWWEDCPAVGTIDPWNGERLSPVGGERVARMIVTAAL